MQILLNLNLCCSVMSIFIAPIGKNVNHVTSWLKEESKDVDILWLIHSKKTKNFDFPAVAKKLEKQLNSVYSQIEIKKIINNDPFNEASTIKIIKDIIDEEEENDPTLLRSEFAVNITGGTNLIAASTMLAATFYGTRAFYILEPQKGDARNTKYVNELPVKSINVAKMKKSQLDVLKIIVNSTNVIENTPKGFDNHAISGCITRIKLLDALGWGKFISGTSRPEGGTRLSGIVKKLIAADFIEKISFVETYVDEDENKSTKVILVDGHSEIISNSKHKPKWKIKQLGQIRYKILANGIQVARDAFLFDT